MDPCIITVPIDLLYNGLCIYWQSIISLGVAKRGLSNSITSVAMNWNSTKKDQFVLCIYFLGYSSYKERHNNLLILFQCLPIFRVINYVLRVPSGDQCFFSIGWKSWVLYLMCETKCSYYSCLMITLFQCNAGGIFFKFVSLFFNMSH